MAAAPTACALAQSRLMRSWRPRRSSRCFFGYDSDGSGEEELPRTPSRSSAYVPAAAEEAGCSYGCESGREEACDDGAPSFAIAAETARIEAASLEVPAAAQSSQVRPRTTRSASSEPASGSAWTVTMPAQRRAPSNRSSGSSASASTRSFAPPVREGSATPATSRSLPCKPRPPLAPRAPPRNSFVDRWQRRGRGGCNQQSRRQAPARSCCEDANSCCARDTTIWEESGREDGCLDGSLSAEKGAEGNADSTGDALDGCSRDSGVAELEGNGGDRETCHPAGIEQSSRTVDSVELQEASQLLTSSLSFAERSLVEDTARRRKLQARLIPQRPLPAKPSPSLGRSPSSAGSAAPTAPQRQPQQRQQPRRPQSARGARAGNARPPSRPMSARAPSRRPSGAGESAAATAVAAVAAAFSAGASTPAAARPPTLARPASSGGLRRPGPSPSSASFRVPADMVASSDPGTTATSERPPLPPRARWPPWVRSALEASGESFDHRLAIDAAGVAATTSAGNSVSGNDVEADGVTGAELAQPPRARGHAWNSASADAADHSDLLAPSVSGISGGRSAAHVGEANARPQQGASERALASMRLLEEARSVFVRNYAMPGHPLDSVFAEYNSIGGSEGRSKRDPRVLEQLFHAVHSFVAAEDMSDSCVICLDSMARSQRVARLPCGHCFHTRCIRRWLVDATCCPLCKCSLVEGAGGVKPDFSGWT
eukprot:TRINITY_DN29096_c1_g3_i1.p1 TRINITY_DN29096_c1_g3~~TRINITY_DN29096_c1_g3_i1.p1  ORF type:complete len:716 (+),score=120.11 TRINITY_DN29096_c1_g3_i1:145-2292(+)